MRRVSKLWTILPWIAPDFLFRWFPSWGENVERAVYDGHTRAEWFHAQIEELHAAQRTAHAPPTVDKG